MTDEEAAAELFALLMAHDKQHLASALIRILGIEYLSAAHKVVEHVHFQAIKEVVAEFDGADEVLVRIRTGIEHAHRRTLT